MPRAKKKVIETHGKIEDTTPKFQHTLLEQVWGADPHSRYGTLDEVAYTAKVNEMTRTDLEAHARLMGVVIVESSLRLREKLLNEFRSYVALVQKPVTPPSPNAKPSDEVRRILAEGR